MALIDRDPDEASAFEHSAVLRPGKASSQARDSVLDDGLLLGSRLGSGDDIGNGEAAAAAEAR